MSETKDTPAPERCEGRYPVPQTSPPRQDNATYRCSLPKGHEGPCGAGDTPAPVCPKSVVSFCSSPGCGYPDGKPCIGCGAIVPKAMTAHVDDFAMMVARLVRAIKKGDSQQIEVLVGKAGELLHKCALFSPLRDTPIPPAECAKEAGDFYEHCTCGSVIGFKDVHDRDCPVHGTTPAADRAKRNLDQIASLQRERDEALQQWREDFEVRTHLLAERDSLQKQLEEAREEFRKAKEWNQLRELELVSLRQLNEGLELQINEAAVVHKPRSHTPTDEARDNTPTAASPSEEITTLRTALASAEKEIETYQNEVLALKGDVDHFREASVLYLNERDARTEQLASAEKTISELQEMLSRARE